MQFSSSEQWKILENTKQLTGANEFDASRRYTHTHIYWTCTSRRTLIIYITIIIYTILLLYVMYNTCATY